MLGLFGTLAQSEDEPAEPTVKPLKIKSLIPGIVGSALVIVVMIIAIIVGCRRFRKKKMGGDSSFHERNRYDIGSFSSGSTY